MRSTLMGRVDFALGLALALLLAPAVSDKAVASDKVPASNYCKTKQLDILLTNDDGYDSIGIKAMRTALLAAGHKVLLVGPATNMSGSSTSVTFATVPVTTVPGGYAVGGTPATTVLLGVTAIRGNVPPDLVVSGINNGANLGPATPISGTVGATIAAITQFTPGIPGVAISTDEMDAADPDANIKHFDVVAKFTARLIGQLIDSSCKTKQPLLPERTALNVNYPPLPPKKVKGLVVAEQGRTPYFSIGYSEVASSVYAPQFASVDDADPNPDADTRLFEEGFVTVVPIDGDYTSPRPVQHQVRNALRGLSVK